MEPTASSSKDFLPSIDTDREAKRVRLATDLGDAIQIHPTTERVEAGTAENVQKKDKNISRRRDASTYVKSRRGQEKDGKNAGRRRGPRQDGESRWGPQAGERDSESTTPRLPKRQCALLIGFCGTGCNGMQIQPDVRTIEGVLFDAMVKAGAVSQDNANDPSKVSLGRAARTDAGVHAAGNLVSIKMITAIPGVIDIVARINEELPAEIRVWGYVRVQNSFNARLSCDSRKYTYFFPTYLLIPPKPGGTIGQQFNPVSSLEPLTEEAHVFNEHHIFWSDLNGSSWQDDLRRKRQWRIGPDQIAQLRETANKFEGTHNFHNFTVGRDFNDRSNQRHMKKIEVSDPAVYGETEWLSITLHGQSFMLHQIVGPGLKFWHHAHPNFICQRKMMSALVLSCRTNTPSRVIDEMYGPQVVNVPKMPSLGLLLEHPIFDSYNRKVVAINEKLQPTDPEYRPPIDFDIHRDMMLGFKQEHIYDTMRVTEDRDGVFDGWIRAIDAYGGSDLKYLNSEGIIPSVAIIKKGEKRANAFKDHKQFDATTFNGHKDSQDAAEEEVNVDKSSLADMEG